LRGGLSISTVPANDLRVPIRLREGQVLDMPDARIRTGRRLAVPRYRQSRSDASVLLLEFVGQSRRWFHVVVGTTNQSCKKGQ
jgi:hypothetical protein